MTFSELFYKRREHLSEFSWYHISWFVIPLLLFMSVFQLLSVFPTPLLASQTLRTTINASSQTVEIGKQIIVDVSISNLGNSTIRNIIASFASPGLSVQQESEWPDTLYPNSQINGFYILEGNTTGNTTIWIVLTYLTNTDKNGNESATQQITDVSDFINVNVIDKSFFTLSYNSIWIGVVTTLIGTLVGVMIPEITRYIGTIRDSKRHHEEMLNKVKDMLSQELLSNNHNIRSSQVCANKNWEIITTEYPSVLSTNIQLVNILSELYTLLEKYNKFDNTQRREMTDDKKKPYYEKIAQALTSLNNL